MKKLSIAVALMSLSIAAPVFACPHKDAAVTADKAKPADKDAKETAKAAPAKTAAPAKADKVSQK